MSKLSNHTHVFNLSKDSLQNQRYQIYLTNMTNSCRHELKLAINFWSSQFAQLCKATELSGSRCKDWIVQTHQRWKNEMPTWTHGYVDSVEIAPKNQKDEETFVKIKEWKELFRECQNIKKDQNLFPSPQDHLFLNNLQSKLQQIAVQIQSDLGYLQKYERDFIESQTQNYKTNNKQLETKDFNSTSFPQQQMREKMREHQDNLTNFIGSAPTILCNQILPYEERIRRIKLKNMHFLLTGKSNHRQVGQYSIYSPLSTQGQALLNYDIFDGDKLEEKQRQMQDYLYWESQIKDQQKESLYQPQMMQDKAIQYDQNIVEFEDKYTQSDRISMKSQEKASQSDFPVLPYPQLTPKLNPSLYNKKKTNSNMLGRKRQH